MKKFFSTVLLLLILIGCSTLSNSEPDPDGLVKKVEDHSENEEPKKSTLVIDTVVNFLKNSHSIDHYGQQLRTRIEQGEFNHLWNESYSIYDATMLDYYEIGSAGQKNLVSFIDVTIKRDNYFQWLQFKAVWDDENELLLNLEYQPIEYWSRINQEGEIKSATTFIEKTLSDIQNFKSNQFGWRYQGENPVISSSIEKIELQHITPMGYLLSEEGKMDEALLKVEYSVPFLENNHHVETMIYVRRYDNQWQIEDIQVLNTEVITISKENKP